MWAIAQVKKTNIQSRTDFKSSIKNCSEAYDKNQPFLLFIKQYNPDIMYWDVSYHQMKWSVMMNDDPESTQTINLPCLIKRASFIYICKSYKVVIWGYMRGSVFVDGSFTNFHNGTNNLFDSHDILTAWYSRQFIILRKWYKAHERSFAPNKKGLHYLERRFSRLPPEQCDFMSTVWMPLVVVYLNCCL